MSYFVYSVLNGVQDLWSWATSTSSSVAPTITDSPRVEKKRKRSDSIHEVIERTSKCSRTEFCKADQVKNIHNVIEEIAYRAFAEKVVELKITQDIITEEQSGQILAHIKAAAHKELFRKDGYATERFKLLDRTQVQKVIMSVAKIIHDRDTKLTNARYFSLSELLMGLDDHNTMVKEILLESWYKCSRIVDCQHSHLQQIKERVGFYAILRQQLEFNLEATLEGRKIFWQKYFPDLRIAEEKNSVQFMNVIDVRHYFRDTQLNYSAEANTLAFVTENVEYEMTEVDLDDKLVTVLDDEDVTALFEPRTVFNYVKNAQGKAAPLLSDKNMTIRQFLTAYFPDKI